MWASHRNGGGLGCPCHKMMQHNVNHTCRTAHQNPLSLRRPGKQTHDEFWLLVWLCTCHSFFSLSLFFAVGRHFQVRRHESAAVKRCWERGGEPLSHERPDSLWMLQRQQRVGLCKGWGWGGGGGHPYRFMRHFNSFFERGAGKGTRSICEELIKLSSKSYKRNQF